MGKCFSGAENTEDIAQFEYKMKTQEIEITYQKNGKKEKLPMRMLSDGLKITISMVADIAYRMAVLNPQLLDHILDETPGIVLIDEVDMHLHPEWQKRIMADLHYIFPKVQFIVTTHSPSVLANVTREHILLLEDGEIYMPQQATYGRDVSTILQQMMKVEVRPKKVLKIISDFYKFLSAEEYDRAKELLNELENILGSEDADVVQARVSYDLEQI